MNLCGEDLVPIISLLTLQRTCELVPDRTAIAIMLASGVPLKIVKFFHGPGKQAPGQVGYSDFVLINFLIKTYLLCDGSY